MNTFYNGDLQSRAKNILDNFREEPDNLNNKSLMPAKAHDSNLDAPYIIDILDDAFFYHNEDERDHDLSELWKQIKN
jgi:hypothetical protein